jgi:HEPN domain-containing protein
MPHDAALIAETRGWLAKAIIDLRAAEFELTGDPMLRADVVFHAQQLAEKAMKGLLTWHGQPFRKTHNLVELGQQCAAVDPRLEPLLRRAAVLTEYAWKFRYPGSPEAPSREEAVEALHLARAVHAAIIEKMPADVTV